MKYIDMHCDTIGRLYEAKTVENEERESENLRRNRGHVDLARMREGSCLGQCFALFTNLKREADPHGYCLALFDYFKRQLEENSGVIRQAVTVDEILNNERAGRMSAILTVEEGAVCEDRMDLLDDLYERGVRMMTLTWNYDNGLATPNRINWENGAAEPETEKGLTVKGFEFAQRMEELGMVIDVSHLGDAGFWDIVRCTGRPFAASHSNARSMAGHTRNLTDDMIRTVAERGGVIGINFCPVFLSSRAKDGQEGISRVSDMIRHIHHLKKVGGIECIGLGSDWDGIAGRLEVDSPAALHLLFEALNREGFTAGEIERIFYGNVLRLFRDVWRE